jgi:DNA topoisomerase-1
MKTALARKIGPFDEPVETAKVAELRYVTDQRPGIRRLRSGRGFRYVDPDGSPVRDAASLRRIRTLAIPPAWTQVWICPDPEGHLQATGRDARGRKQYRYHPRWRSIRDASKYTRMLHFGTALPAIRRQIRHDLRLPGLPREKVLAAVVRLLEATLVRVGNEEYARANRSYGLTTLRNRHVRVRGDNLRFRFTGKGGKVHEIGLRDPHLARLVRRCLELPGQELFQFVDESGEPRPVSSTDINDYLRTITSSDFTAKDFRTWAGTLLLARQLPLKTTGLAIGGKPAALEAVRKVAAELRNTPAICRKCYIHPVLLQVFEDEKLLHAWWKAGPGPRRRMLTTEESVLIRFLRGHGPDRNLVAA